MKIYHYFPLVYEVVLALFIDKIILSPLNYLGTLLENQLTINEWIYFLTLKSVPLICMSGSVFWKLLRWFHVQSELRTIWLGIGCLDVSVGREHDTRLLEYFITDTQSICPSVLNWCFSNLPDKNHQECLWTIDFWPLFIEETTRKGVQWGRFCMWPVIPVLPHGHVLPISCQLIRTSGTWMFNEFSMWVLRSE